MLRSFTFKQRRVLIALAGLAALVASAVAYAAVADAPWPMGGQNINDTRASTSNLNADNVKNLALKWKLTTHGDVSATRAVVGGALYFPDWAGYMYKVDAETGAVIWSHQVSRVRRRPGRVARTSPTVDGDTVYIGDQNGGNLIAVDAATGDARWSTALGRRQSVRDRHAIAGRLPGRRLRGLASSEEGAVAFIPNYPCCFFARLVHRGRRGDGPHPVADGHGAAGVQRRRRVERARAAIDPGSRTALHQDRQQLLRAAKRQGLSAATAGQPHNACSPDDHIDSIVRSEHGHGRGEVGDRRRRLRRLERLGCIFTLRLIRSLPRRTRAPTTDFGSGLNLFTIKMKGKDKLVVGAGQKSGQYWAPRRQRPGTILWSAAPGPGSDARRHRVGHGDRRQADLHRGDELLPTSRTSFRTDTTITSGARSSRSTRRRARSTGKWRTHAARPIRTPSISARPRLRTASSTPAR